MIKLENYEVVGWEHAIRGMRNPMNSWDRSDTCIGFDNMQNIIDGVTQLYIGSNDHDLMMKLAKGGPVHAKYRRMITVYVDITAPLYWWKEFDTYKVGTVANSCSTMHKIHEKEFTLDDFSHEHLINQNIHLLNTVIDALNAHRVAYLNTTTDINANHTRLSNKACATLKKDIWWQMIQLLPSSYNQKRTIMLNYEVLVGIYKHRKNHKLDEWRVFCEWIKTLSYSEIIMSGVEE